MINGLLIKLSFFFSVHDLFFFFVKSHSLDFYLSGFFVGLARAEVACLNSGP